MGIEVKEKRSIIGGSDGNPDDEFLLTALHDGCAWINSYQTKGLFSCKRQANDAMGVWLADWGPLVKGIP